MKNNFSNINKKNSPIKKPLIQTNYSNTPNSIKKILFSDRKETKERETFIAKTDVFDSNTNRNKQNITNINLNTPKRPLSSKIIKNNPNKSLNQNFNNYIHPSNSNKQLNNYDFNPSDLIFDVNDDHKTLMTKNTKLRSLLVQASNKMNEFSTKLKEKEEEYKKEKTGILQELDKITKNYQTYAEGYKKFTTIDEELKNLQIDYKHNYNVLISYQDSLSIFLKDYMNLYKLITSFVNNKLSKNPLQFLCDIKELLFDNLTKYKDSIDIMNFQDIFNEYNDLMRTRIFKNYTVSTHPQENLIKASPKNKNIKEQNLPYSKSDKDLYNLPLKQNNKNKSKSPSKSEKDIINKVNINKQIIKPHKNLSVENELKDLANAINNNIDKINNNLIISKESLNCSSGNISNVFEKHSHANNNVLFNPNFNKNLISFDNTRYEDIEETPQFQS